MKFEGLPNELIFDLFEYFNIIDLFRAFYRLNSRIDNLLNDYDQKYYLDFRCISKHDCEIICRDYLTIITKQIISLHLSDDDETPISSKILFSNGFILDKCNHLQSLSLYHIHSLNRIYNIIKQCQYIPTLTHLTFIKCQFWQNENDFKYFINIVWRLPKLTHCTLDYILPGQRLLTQISNISQSIEYLSMKNIHCDFNTLTHLFQFTPNLRQLYTTIFCGCRDEQLQTNISSIISLNIIHKSSLNTMISLFHHMINLRYLTLETDYIYLDGSEWKKLIIENLPNIKTFRLRMFFELSSVRNREKEIDTLLNSFRTPFWIRKHRWFVQCDWTLSKSQKHAVLYTLPYSFNHFLYDNLCRSKSTCINNQYQSSYDRVSNLQYLEYESNSIINKLNSHCSIQCPNIQHLELRLPYNDKFFWSFVPTLNQLYSLDIMLNNNFAYYQLQALLDQAPCLYSLTFRCLKNISMALFRLRSKSIRRLDFISTSTLQCGHFKKFECDALAESLIGRYCNVLLIKVQNRMNIPHLIKTMLHLRSMVVQCEDDNPENDELLIWLYTHLLSSSCSIERDKDEPSKIRMWIR
ncbi:unnamed protein product [Adineta steineri]|uniref:F-box domain-containing protein n=1 Tax=Adineta steineri TaxID=433720 RepID=A0A814QU02_9BILA|nr:unnamed protein product [Adineta steineri]CAF1124483.1 unnamed protein product [Adineta steineri]